MYYNDLMTIRRDEHNREIVIVFTGLGGKDMTCPVFGQHGKKIRFGIDNVRRFVFEMLQCDRTGSSLPLRSKDNKSGISWDREGDVVLWKLWEADESIYLSPDDTKNILTIKLPLAEFYRMAADVLVEYYHAAMFDMESRC